MKNIAVFCGSNVGKSDIYRDAALSLGRAFAVQKIGLVYGGTNKGLMKIVAEALLENGGEAHGFIPQSLVEKGQRYERLTTTEVVATRSLRKIRMAEVSDGFIAMPGGIGTIEELFEMWVDAQFDGHKKPIGLYNVDGFYDGLLHFVQTMIDQGFVPPQQKDMVIVDSDPEKLIASMRTYTPITIPKWMA
jgi:uncharacterized protein (TIGR00730 family)